MIRTVTIEILSKKAINLLKNMELDKLIRMRIKKEKKTAKLEMYKGAMTKQSVESVEKQLKELRSAWE